MRFALVSNPTTFLLRPESYGKGQAYIAKPDDRDSFVIEVHFALVFTFWKVLNHID